MRLNDPEEVRREYADETRFSVRQAVWNSSTGPDAHEVALELLRRRSPRHVLEVGPGKGELAERLAAELAADVVAVDQSERMVELTRGRGIDARVGDIQALPFPDGTFDAVVAAWMLYHVPDLDRGLSEVARVLAAQGSFVAVTNSEANLLELWSRAGEGTKRNHPFSAENGAAALSRHFAAVEQIAIEGEVTFADWATARAYVAASPSRSELAERLEPFQGPLVARRRVTIFVAEKTA